jgi:hypothetical protein
MDASSSAKPASVNTKPKASRFHEPAVVCAYAKSGSGKTTDNGYSFPCALFLAAPGALKPLITVCGYDPHRAGQVRRMGVADGDIRTIDDATKVLKVEASRGVYDAVVVDDFSYLAEQTFALLEKRLTGFKLWGELRDQTLDFRNTARSCGMHVLMNCWEGGPKTKAGRWIRGGPQLPSDLPEQMPAMCDLVLRGGREELRKPWPGVYLCPRADTDYVAKDRHHVTPEVAPMNLAEILRHAGYDVKRHPGLPWQEEAVIKIAAALLKTDGAEWPSIGNIAVEALTSKGYGRPYIVWTLRDAVDRAVLQRAQPTVAQAFGWGT